MSGKVSVKTSIEGSLGCHKLSWWRVLCIGRTNKENRIGIAAGS